MDEVASSHSEAIFQIIKSHGGSITLKTLEDAYRSRYSISIPYVEHGFSTPQDYLLTCGLQIDVVDGEEYFSTASTVKSKSLLDNEVEPLCVSLSNDLVLGHGSNHNSRVVSVQTERPKQLITNRKRFTFKSLLPDRFDETKHGKNSSHESFDDGTHFSSTNSINEYDSSHDSSLFSTCSDPPDGGFHSNNHFGYIENNNTSGHVEPDLHSVMFDYSTNLSGDIYNVPNMLNFGQKNLPNFRVDVNSIPDSSYYQFDANKITGTIPDPFNCIDDSSYISHIIESQKQFAESDTKYIYQLEQLIDEQKESISTDDLESAYHHYYRKFLPVNWLENIRKSNQFYVEVLKNRTVIYPTRNLNTTPTMSLLPQMNYPKDKTWEIHVNAVSSSTSVWFHICELDISYRHAHLHSELLSHYKTLTRTTTNILRYDELYAVWYENEVVRVRVLEGQLEQVKCFLIDVGVVRQFRTNELLPLHEKFTNTPPLAVQGSLTNLEQYDTCEYVNSKLRTRIEHQNCSAKVNYIHEDGRVSFNLLMWGPTQRVNVNDAVLKEILMELTLPNLEIGQSYQARILWNEGEKARIQIKSPCLNLLREALSVAKQIIEAAGNDMDLYPKSMNDLCLNNEVYLTKYKNTWQRVSLKQIFSSTKVVALFIDLGELEVLDFSSIVKPTYPNFSDTLAIIPPQAIELNIVDTNPITLSIVQQIKKNNWICLQIVETKPKLFAKILLNVPKH